MKSSKIIYEKSCPKQTLKPIPIVQNKNNPHQTTVGVFLHDPMSSSPPNQFIVKLHSRMAAFSCNTESLVNSSNFIKV
jgi:hypothetical protein